MRRIGSTVKSGTEGLLLAGPRTSNNRQRIVRNLRRNYDLYFLLAPVLVYFLIFHYGPMYGVQIAFKDYSATDGIWGSPWVGFKHFLRFFNSFQFWTLIRNTLYLSLYSTLAGFPAPIILAILLNYLRSKKYKKLIQTVTYAPHFISTVVLIGMMYVFLAPTSGAVNTVLAGLGLESINFMARPEWFRDLYVFSGIWQRAGFGAIIYLSALTSIDPELHESAVIDGANRLKRIWYIDLPGILPTVVILLILDLGRIMSVGFEKAFLMQTALNLTTSEIIPTYVYKVGLLNAQYSFSTAVGLFNAVVNLTLLIAVDRLAKRLANTSLW
jgi:putative aldouronate transport system permease protein